MRKSATMHRIYNKIDFFFYISIELVKPSTNSNSLNERSQSFIFINDYKLTIQVICNFL